MGKSIGCLVIHGFGGSIREVEPLVAAMHQMGFVTSCPALKGHTGNKKDLTQCTWQDWIKSAEDELLCMQEQCDEVFICGFSMGGLIGMQLSLRYPVSGLVTINTPIMYLDIKKMIQNVIYDIRTGDYSNIRRYLKPSNRLPLKALINFRKLLQDTKKLIPFLSAPMLIAQAIDDDVVNHKSAGYIFTKAARAQKQVATYVRGGHVILLSDACHAVVKDITDFLLRNSASKAA